jgi:casein kinase I family protein HRR25
VGQVRNCFIIGNLEELRKKQIGEKFSEHCIVRLAYCLISVIEACHERKYVHRDIKPENFLVGSYGD